MKKTVSVGIVLLCALIIQNLASSILGLLQKNDILVSAQKELEAEKRQNDSLKKQLSQVQNPSFIEQQARDKLFLTKPGENLVILPNASASAESAPAKAKTSNLDQWFSLFFYTE